MTALSTVFAILLALGIGEVLGFITAALFRGSKPPPEVCDD